eukprot:6741940-Heterocapsa_arctica.AAC.1
MQGKPSQFCTFPHHHQPRRKVCRKVGSSQVKRPQLRLVRKLQLARLVAQIRLAGGIPARPSPIELPWK